MKLNNNKIWDVIIVGGGPAGMMAAGRAAELGKSVLLLEKNLSLGKKLLITGGGRCNLTNYKSEMSTFISMFRDKPKALYSIFSQFGVIDTVEFFNLHGMHTKIENEDRVFPVSDDSKSVLKTLLKYMRFGGVTIQNDVRVVDIMVSADKSVTIKTNKFNIYAKSCIIATGNISYPKTGSTGDGFKWLQKLGHTINQNDFSLVPIALYDSWICKLAGVTLKDIKITIVQNNKKIQSKIGKVLFTHIGISGPTILNMSSLVGDLLKKGEVIIELDLCPEMSHGELKSQLQKIFITHSNKKIKNVLDLIIPKPLIIPLLNLNKIDPDTLNHSITRGDRSRLIQMAKVVPLSVKKLLGSDKAIVSSGGININEVDFKTMKSKIVSNIFIVGDLLDIDRPSGGYSLQICWSTGFVAGSNC